MTTNKALDIKEMKGCEAFVSHVINATQKYLEQSKGNMEIIESSLSH